MKSAVVVIVLTLVLAQLAAAGTIKPMKQLATSATTIAPLAMSNRSLGGSALNTYTPGVNGGKGVNNLGLLVMTNGAVTYVDTVNQFFYIDDGSMLWDGTKRPDNSMVLGVRVSYNSLASGVTVHPPALNAHVYVIGISSTVLVNSAVCPNVRVRRDADILAFL